MAKTWIKALAYSWLMLVLGACQQETNETLLRQLDQEISQFESLIELTDLRIELKPAKSTPFDASNNSNFEETLANEIKTETLQNFFDSLSVGIRIAHPYTLINVDTDLYKLQSLLGHDSFYFMEHADMTPRFHPTEVVYLDGQRASVTDEYVSKAAITAKYKADSQMENRTPAERWVLQQSQARSSSDFFVLTKAKPITSITYDISLPYRETRVGHASAAGDTLSTPAGDIKLLAITGNQIRYQIPTAVAEHITVQALYQDGRPLRKQGSNSATLYSGQKINDLRQALDEMRGARKQVKRGRITTQEELEKYLEPRLDGLPGLQEPAQYLQVTATYAGPVSKVTFIIPESDVKTLNFTSTYPLDTWEEEKEYRVAADFATGKNGIIDNDGNWMVEPAMDQYFRMLNRHYFTDQIDNRENQYHFDPATGRLKKVDYLLVESAIYQDRYVRVSRQTNGPRGLAEVATGKVVLPMEHTMLHLQDEKFWIAGKNGKEGVLDSALRQVLPARFDNIDFDNGFFQARRGKTLDLYDSKGRNLTHGKYDHFKRFSDGRLLASVSRKNQDGLVRQYAYFLDRQGKVAIDLAARGFSQAKVFRNGLAAVRDAESERWGFINPAGKLVLPMRYKDVSFGFFEASGYAPVRLSNGTSALIDKQGNVIKTFTGSFSHVRYEGDDENRYLRAGKNWYDAFGNPVQPE
ncbi:WG repeat-containing protein [Alloalcanivorax xenomutans]|uniref:WG repeat-containing protein n=1 Tax=Alloalcanivorax xenomutans TaxID=1094342 RepID=UPI003D9B041C